MSLPEENADEPPYALEDDTTSYKNTPLSRRPSILTFGSEPFIQQTLFKRETDCPFDLPHHKNIYLASESSSGLKYARRDTKPSDATALICCNTAAKLKCKQWKTPERYFTEDFSLSAFSKKVSQPTCFNSADIACKPQKEALAFQRQDERLSSSTFHELLESSWMSANLHCSMLHFSTDEQAVSFVEHQTPNLSVSTSAVSSLAIPAVTEREWHSSYIPRGIKRQPRNEQFQCCNTRFSSSHVPRVSVHRKQPNKSGESREKRPDDNKLAFDSSTELNPLKRLEMQENLRQMHPLVIQREDIKNNTQTMQRVYRGASKLAGRRNELVSFDGQCFTSHQHLPFAQCKAVSATQAQISAQLDVTPEAYDDFDEKKMEERCENLYRFRLRLRCLRMWSKRLGLLYQACYNDRRRVLNKALYVLRWSAKIHCAQTDALERRRSNILLYQSFYKWKNHYESRHLDNSFHNERNTDALRKRLIQPSTTLVLMTTCSTWRNLHVLRTAVIHYHLSVLYKHWLQWKRVCFSRFAMRQQEWRACVWWDRQLQSRVWTLWVLTWKRKQLAKNQYRMHLLASAWMNWKIKNSQKKLEKLMHSTQISILLHSFRQWLKRAESCQRERENFFVLSRRILHSWHCYVQKKKLTRLSTRVPWVLSRRMLAVNFRKWREVTRWTQETRGCLERERHLQDKGRMQTRFTIWRQRAWARKELRRVRENLQRAQLSRCFSAWRTLVQRSALHLHYFYHRKALTLKTCLQQWSRSLQLNRLQKDFLIHQFHTRQKNTGCTVEVFKWRTRISAQELSAMLLLHNTLHKWTEILVKQQLAQSHRTAQDRAVQRAVLLEWYRHTQAVFSDGVLLFTARLAHLPPSSKSTAASQVVLLRALGRMMHPELSLAFSQWRHLVHTNREMELQGDLCRKSRRRKQLTVVFRVWRVHTQMHCRAVWHWERRMCLNSVIQWKQMVWQRCWTRMLEQHATLNHDTTLLRRCFCLWTRMAVGPHCEQQKCAVERIESKAGRHRLNLSFSTWVTCVSQQQTARAVYVRTLQNRVFSAWLRCVQVCKQRQASALFFSRYRLLRVSFCQWRIIRAQQQLANSKVQNRVYLRVKVILQQWRKHVHYWAHRQALLYEYEERGKIVMKRRTFLMWSQAVEYFRRSQLYHQRTLKYRYFSLWLHEFRHHAELLCISRELEEVRTQRLQQRAFCLWQLKLSHTHSQILHITSLIHRWEDPGHLRLYLCEWRERLVERKRARLVMHQWRQLISRARKQRNIVRTMKNMFLCWKTAFRQRARSRDHCTQRQQRRVLLAWYRQTVSAQRRRYREAWFQYSSEMRLLAAVFMQWRRALIQGQQRKCAMESQLIIYQSRVSGRAFHLWRTAATESRANKTFNNRLLHKLFKRWTHSKDLLKVADLFCVKKERSEARLALRTWSLWAKEHKALRQMGEAVSLWLEGRGVSRTFHHWVRVYQKGQKSSQHRQTQLSHSRIRAVERRVQRLTHLYWTCWKNQTEASLLYTQQYERSVLQRTWLTWRKRHIRNRISADYSSNFNSMLLTWVLHMWWQRAHGSFEP
ncbi:uncharacterized protein [Pseudorasbora parva]|uniref:uncharacterized protein isoform X2 n=1 Tax=Pseudorasbora parva TaxID=51549 RepID=UPI00351E5FD1